MSNYVGSKKACEILGIHYQSLRNWRLKNKIEYIKTPGGKHLYNVSKYISLNVIDDIDIDNNNNINININNKNNNNNVNNKVNICYCRVSTRGQKNDLERQISYMREKYPDHLIINDIASGINFKRTGLKKILNYAINGNLNELVIAYKDRLCRFGYELIEHIINEYSGGKIIILNDTNISTTEELTKDLVSIINVFSAKLNGLRKYNKK